MSAFTAVKPVKGMVVRHVKATMPDWSQGGNARKPAELTVTSVRGDIVYTKTHFHDTFKMNLATFGTGDGGRILEVVSTPEVKEKAKTPRLTQDQCRSLFAKADKAGNAAAFALTPVPMVVQQLENPFDRNSAVVYQEFVNDGVCGFAWVTVRPGNSAFARYLKAAGMGRNGTYGGVMMWVGGFRQSMQKKEAYAVAFAAVLREAGIEARAESRMD